jgi:hypothetical protein
MYRRVPSPPQEGNKGNFDNGNFDNGAHLNHHDLSLAAPTSSAALLAAAAHPVEASTSNDLLPVLAPPQHHAKSRPGRNMHMPSTASLDGSHVHPHDHFPLRLHRMLCHSSKTPGLESIATWSQCGGYFRIHNRDRFARELLPEFFPFQNHYKSFMRQISLYKLRRIKQSGPLNGFYHHPYFHRDDVEKCFRLKRESTNKSAISGKTRNQGVAAASTAKQGHQVSLVSQRQQADWTRGQGAANIRWSEEDIDSSAKMRRIMAGTIVPPYSGMRPFPDTKNTNNFTLNVHDGAATHQQYAAVSGRSAPSMGMILEESADASPDLTTYLQGLLQQSSALLSFSHHATGNHGPGMNTRLPHMVPSSSAIETTMARMVMDHQQHHVLLHEEEQQIKNALLLNQERWQEETCVPGISKEEHHGAEATASATAGPPSCPPVTARGIAAEIINTFGGSGDGAATTHSHNAGGKNEKERGQQGDTKEEAARLVVQHPQELPEPTPIGNSETAAAGGEDNAIPAKFWAI